MDNCTQIALCVPQTFAAMCTKGSISIKAIFVYCNTTKEKERVPRHVKLLQRIPQISKSLSQYLIYCTKKQTNKDGKNPKPLQKFNQHTLEDSGVN